MCYTRSRACCIASMCCSTEKEQELELEMAKIKVAKEKLELEMALAESSAKLKVFKEYEASENSYYSVALAQRPRPTKVYQEDTSLLPPQTVYPSFRAQPQMQQFQVPQVAQQSYSSTQASRDDKELKVTQNQNVITELLVKQQKRFRCFFYFYYIYCTFKK